MSTAETITAIYNQTLRAHNGLPPRRFSICRKTLRAVENEQHALEEHLGGPDPKWALDVNVRYLFNTWDWTRSPAPLALLGSKKLWNAVLFYHISKLNQQAQARTEIVKKAQNWINAQLELRAKTQNINRQTLEDILQAAHALGIFDSLSQSEKQSIADQFLTQSP